MLNTAILVPPEVLWPVPVRIVGIFFRRDPYAVIGYQEYNIRIFHPSCHDYGSGFCAFFKNSVQDGILYHRLQSQLGDLVIQKRIGNVGNKLNTVVKTHILDLGIYRYMLDFLGDGADASFTAERELVKAGKILHGAADFKVRPC